MWCALPTYCLPPALLYSVHVMLSCFFFICSVLVGSIPWDAMLHSIFHSEQHAPWKSQKCSMDHPSTGNFKPPWQPWQSRSFFGLGRLDCWGAQVRKWKAWITKKLNAPFLAQLGSGEQKTRVDQIEERKKKPTVAFRATAKFEHDDPYYWHFPFLPSVSFLPGFFFFLWILFLGTSLLMEKNC